MAAEPPCGKIDFIVAKEQFPHAWHTSVVNGLETGLCSTCGLVRMRILPSSNPYAYASAVAYQSFWYYKPEKRKK